MKELELGIFFVHASFRFVGRIGFSSGCFANRLRLRL
jgi:hypothetical protein